ncbi:MAG TPA: PQQ-binding-like beta-propeller repeat protein [Steroidobacteraceae bacterium]|jgi:alcohol dehydrogenase (cytochrome c)|nr:PQQ-binding-like beta-propeller repeat protein [Steroidobacteraceae bacterium]
MKTLGRILLAALLLVGVTAGIGLLIMPTPLTLLGAVTNTVRTLSNPPGTLSVEVRPGSPAPELGAAPTDTPDPNEWPSYNRTLTSQRFSPLDQINRQNIKSLRVLCVYDSGIHEGFESGPIMVDGALIATGAFDTFSIDPSSCRQNWRVHENYTPRSPVLASRGAAYLQGRVFRGTLDGRVLAYDSHTGHRLWQASVADPKLGTNICSAPIAWDGMVFAGICGGDSKGIKGRMYGIAADSGRIVWETYLVPKQAGDPSFGPAGRIPDGALQSWDNRDTPGLPISGGGTWTSYTLDPATGWLYIPVGNPSPDFVDAARAGSDLYVDSVLILDAKTGDYVNHFQMEPRDWHDYDMSNPPALIHTRAGARLMTFSPKNGYLYGVDAASNELRYRVPVTRIENQDTEFSTRVHTHFCPGAGGGGEWNGAAYDPRTNLTFTAETDWCGSATRATDAELKSVGVGSAWMGAGSHETFGRTDPISQWGGWVYATDADSGEWKWRARSNYPTLSGVTPTAGGLVFLGDHGGNLYALNSSNGQPLWSLKVRGPIAGGIISYSAGGSQRIAVAYGMTSALWVTVPSSAKIMILGLP